MEEEIANLKLSSLHCIIIYVVSLREALGSTKSTLSILSFNAQSINAKFDDFKLPLIKLMKNIQLAMNMKTREHGSQSSRKLKMVPVRLKDGSHFGSPTF